MILHFAIAGFMTTYGNPVDSVNDNENLRWIIDGPAGRAVISLSYIFVGVYGWMWGFAAWISASEVFPMRYRAKGVGAAAATNWAFNFALAYFVAPVFTNIQWWTYILFGVFCAAMTIRVCFLYPETAGKSIEEMDYLFESKVPAWRSGSVKGFEQKVQDRVAEKTDAESGVVQNECQPVAEKQAGTNSQEQV